MFSKPCFAFHLIGVVLSFGMICLCTPAANAAGWLTVSQCVRVAIII